MLAGRHLLRNSLRNLVKTGSCRRNYEPGTKAYDGDGKTTATVLNTEEGAGLMIDSFSQTGFRLNNGMMVVGPMAIFPRTVISWNINSFLDIDDKSLSLFTVLEPKIDVLVIGIGDQSVTAELSKKLMLFMKRYDINVEVLPTEQACTTFNFLNNEGRMTAAAMIPPLVLSISEEDYSRYKLERHKIFEIE